MVELFIDEVCPKSEAHSFITHFQNGYPAENFTEQECVILEHKDSNKKIIACDINNILYTGAECDETLGKVLVLARNRTTGKVRLIELGNVELKPKIASKVATSEHETSYIELGRKFGSKKHKKVLEQNEKLKVNEEVVMEQLKDVSHNVSQDQLDLSTYNKNDSDEFYLPPVNKEATALEDVYNLTSILTHEQYNTIFSELDSNGEYKTDMFPFVKEMVSDDWSKEQTVLAVYANSLLLMNGKVIKDMKIMKFAACPYSATLDKIILKDFFTYNGNMRQRPLHYKDKALCHAIVFLFLINNYKFDIESFCKQVKLVEKTANTKISMTGGWITKQGSKKIAILKLPLNKATSSFSRRKSAKF